MDPLAIRVLGNLVLDRGDAQLPPFPTRRSEALFAYLVIHRDRLLHRDVLCGAFWGDLPDAHARKCLRTALWRIRSVIESDSCDRGTVLRVEGDQIGLLASPRVWVDVWELEECVRLSEVNGKDLDDAGARRLASVARLYRGDFMEGHYDGWCAQPRDRYRLGLLTTMERLLSHHREKKDWLGAIAWGQRLLSHDPLREHVHRALMFCHRAMGDRPSALRQYQQCAQVLRDELDIEPMEETRALHARIRDDSEPWGTAVPEDEPVAAPNGERTPQGLAAEVSRALDQLHALTTRLERTYHALHPGGGNGRDRHGSAPPGSGRA
jgi:DNA-binding SARP family transcriptional activator